MTTRLTEASINQFDNLKIYLDINKSEKAEDLLRHQLGNLKICIGINWVTL